MAGRARGARGGRAAAITQDTGISTNFKDTEYKEKGSFYDGPDPASGLYPLKLTSVGAHTTSDTAIVWTFDITEGKYAGWRGWMYSDLDNAKWKTQDILVALGVIEPNDEINKTYEQIMKEAQPCRGRVVSEPYEGEARAKIRTLLAGVGTTADTEADDDEDDDPDFDDKKPARRGKTRPDEGPDSADEGDDDARQDREEELDNLSSADLKKAAKAAGLTLKDYRGKEDSEIIEMILDKEFPEADEDDAAEGIDLDALEEELEDLDVPALKKKAKEFQATRAELKEAGDDEEALIDLILEKAEEQNPSF